MPPTTSPRVTVIIPTYNWSTVLPYSIGSVLDQNFTDFELLVIGDGCTDDSEAVVKAVDDPRVRWIGIERSGHQSGPNNEGIRQARGEFIAYLNHDDLWLPQHLDVLVRALDAGADLAHTLAMLVPPPRSGQPVQVAPELWRPPSSVMHRRSVIDKAGGWRHFRELRTTPEADLWARFEAAGCRMVFVPRMTAVRIPAGWRRDVYRQRPCDEQAAWLARIRSEPDLEVVQLAKLVARKKAPFTYRVLRLLSHPSEWLSILWRRKGSRLAAWQRFKGVR